METFIVSDQLSVISLLTSSEVELMETEGPGPPQVLGQGF